ncbi:MAG: DUF3048 domain-containing protein [Actinomycetota bacterium]
MSRRAKLLAAGGGVVVVAVAAFFLLSDKSDLPVLGGLIEPETCPLSGIEPRNESRIERPAVAVKVENAAVAYPLSGLEEAEIVYEELVEGGVTRFMAIYHCADSSKVGPVRSARIVDPAIMTPITRVLAYSGANRPVVQALEEAEIVSIDEDVAIGTDALQRVERPGISSEHTLYANSSALRRLGRKSYDDPPPDDLLAFGDLEGRSRKAGTITINFNPSNTIGYEWSGDGWLRFEGEQPFMMESGDQLEVENVLIEEHVVNLSETIVDVAGNPSTEIEDVTGSGPAVLFRDGRAIRGSWTREEIEGPVVFETRSGDEMVFAAGSVWIELVPSDEGDVKGSFDFAR